MHGSVGIKRYGSHVQLNHDKRDSINQSLCLCCLDPIKSATQFDRCTVAYTRFIQYKQRPVLHAEVILV